ncbi:MAG TPA: aminodeoxychorismate synthase component I [Terracidiphilus sp.]|nr:aminodeoxychorismate synthase component I [Terracidiphilus sp.]
MTLWHPLPPQIFEYIEHTPGTVLLHSSRRGKTSFSRFFTSPLQIIEVRELKDLPALFYRIEKAIAHGLLAAGYFAYECANYFEPAASVRLRRDSDLLAWFGIYGSCHTFDHSLGTFDSDLLLPRSLERGKDGHGPTLSPAIGFRLDEQQFTSRIDQIHDWIRAGDVYQLNFTFPFRAQFAESASALYSRLALAQPVEYGAFLHTEPLHHILSFSPELFFRIDKTRRITTQPMKGTASRGRTTSEDGAIAKWLAHDPKNRAENVMIVDLIRNDLGRICSFGSVNVEKLFEVEHYPSLWQMTSRISGDLLSSIGYKEIFRALFPCGSVTGAPKIRAMQLIAQIEEESRGVYTGAIGYFSLEETIFNVAIRTLVLENGTASGGIGSGIVIDSRSGDEYRECQLKAEFLTRSTEEFSLIETMLWNGSFPYLELHLDRLADSASYFNVQWDRDAIRDKLLIQGSRLSGNQPRKFRLLLRSNGASDLEIEPLPNLNQNDALRVCIAKCRTDPADLFLFHKTTRRALYNRAYATACSSGFADVLFFNTRDEVTEGAVNNVFIEKSGLWYTPPLDCGVLPGVYRRHLLSTHPEIEEEILDLNDLKAADGVYICNAVHGLRRVIIDWDASLHY